MIRIQRGSEPHELATVRVQELARVTAIAVARAPTSDEIGREYQIVQRILYERQYRKCCYCEFGIQQSYNDVEHYRPKTEANRLPGSTATHGYWWLAWTWSNLLYSCPTCNRSFKKTKFPLAIGSRAILPQNAPPGAENAYLLDPAATIDPIDHIQFRQHSMLGRSYWIPFPRNNSLLGDWTIRVVGLQRPDLRDHYNLHVNNHVVPSFERIEQAIRGGNLSAIRTKWQNETVRLLNARLPFSGLSFDALDFFLPAALRQQYGLVLLRPSPRPR